jgi:hypothetical protein
MRSQHMQAASVAAECQRAARPHLNELDGGCQLVASDQFTGVWVLLPLVEQLSISANEVVMFWQSKKQHCSRLSEPRCSSVTATAN